MTHQWYERAVPDTVPRERISPCKRSCCWTPYGHTLRPGCTCHAPIEREF